MYVHCREMYNLLVLASKQKKNLVKDSLFFLLLKLVQINFILANNVRILSMYMDILVNDTPVKFVSTPCTDPLPSIDI